ncbi:histone-like nucleoid-structuring protein Lsr2 [Homoserinibacter sp. YIM 151385]|uniref:histone-like nucleoid-structuring protein Lsr2 n=1 Tax=Homoserinibacter sp. YIM 151385 TaxID=2985506 RepID=UPI0022F0BD61|nr:Lsr2 family protein [Homoserinibacter sp. YIM 151385]WBU38448.1 Lsr2 family protein [Homoserinibacter sp. YIM 151385]
MATKTTVILIDDLDGEELPAGTSPTTFSLDGAQYRIDLGSANRAALEKALEPFIEVAVRTGASSGGRKSGSSGGGSGRTSPEKLAAIRVWAAGRGIELPSRGRIKQSVIDEFDASH